MVGCSRRRSGYQRQRAMRSVMMDDTPTTEHLTSPSSLFSPKTAIKNADYVFFLVLPLVTVVLPAATAIAIGRLMSNIIAAVLVASRYERHTSSTCSSREQSGCGSVSTTQPAGGSGQAKS